jgi:hypothetical protein
MDPEQIDHIIAALERVLAPFGVDPRQHHGTDTIRDDYDAAAHCRWMLAELRAPGLRMDAGKVNRWIGCVLGLLMGTGQITPDHARDLVYRALTLT